MPSYATPKSTMPPLPPRDILTLRLMLGPAGSRSCGPRPGSGVLAAIRSSIAAPSASATSVILGTADLLRATRAAAVFARDNSNVIRLECTPPPEDGIPALGQVLVKAMSAEMGDNVGQLDASVHGDAGQI